MPTKPPRRDLPLYGRSAGRDGAGRGRPDRARVWWTVGFLASCFAVVAVLVVVGSSRGNGDAAGSVSEPEAFNLPALEGDGRVALADFRGQPVVVNFFASWCTVCDFELPHFAHVSDELRGQVTFVGVNALETGDPMTMPNRHGITWWPLARDFGADGNELHTNLGGRGMPITAYYGPDGQLLHVDPGGVDEATLRSRITALFGLDA